MAVVTQNTTYSRNSEYWVIELSALEHMKYNRTLASLYLAEPGARATSTVRYQTPADTQSHGLTLHLAWKDKEHPWAVQTKNEKDGASLTITCKWRGKTKALPTPASAFVGPLETYLNTFVGFAAGSQEGVKKESQELPVRNPD